MQIKTRKHKPTTNATSKLWYYTWPLSTEEVKRLSPYTFRKSRLGLFCSAWIQLNLDELTAVQKLLPNNTFELLEEEL